MKKTQEQGIPELPRLDLRDLGELAEEEKQAMLNELTPEEVKNYLDEGRETVLSRRLCRYTERIYSIFSEGFKKTIAEQNQRIKPEIIKEIKEAIGVTTLIEQTGERLEKLTDVEKRINEATKKAEEQTRITETHEEKLEDLNYKLKRRARSTKRLDWITFCLFLAISGTIGYALSTKAKREYNQFLLRQGIRSLRQEIQQEKERDSEKFKELQKYLAGFNEEVKQLRESQEINSHIIRTEISGRLSSLKQGLEYKLDEKEKEINLKISEIFAQNQTLKIDISELKSEWKINFNVLYSFASQISQLRNSEEGLRLRLDGYDLEILQLSRELQQTKEQGERLLREYGSFNSRYSNLEKRQESLEHKFQELQKIKPKKSLRDIFKIGEDK